MWIFIHLKSHDRFFISCIHILFQMKTTRAREWKKLTVHCLQVLLNDMHKFRKKTGFYLIIFDASSYLVTYLILQTSLTLTPFHFFGGFNGFLAPQIFHNSADNVHPMTKLRTKPKFAQAAPKLINEQTPTLGLNAYSMPVVSCKPLANPPTTINFFRFINLEVR